MFQHYEYDPAVHRVDDNNPVGRFLRKELRTDKLVVYHHQVFNTWVVSLRNDRGELWDIGLLGSGDGEGPWSTQQNTQNIIRRVHNLIDAVQINKKLRQWKRKVYRQAEEHQQLVFAGHQAAYKSVYDKHGPVKAEQYARVTNETACLEKGDGHF